MSSLLLLTWKISTRTMRHVIRYNLKHAESARLHKMLIHSELSSWKNNCGWTSLLANSTEVYNWFQNPKQQDFISWKNQSINTSLNYCFLIRCICPGSCDPVTGSCSCPPGFQGPNCQEACADGWYGANCSQRCNCMNSASCSHVDGSCTCTPGWSGVNCTERCPAGYYGMLCASKCQCNISGTEGTSLCNSVTGECNCSLGYHGYR